ncbi:calcium ion binding [Branchiostoma belcheri]|nr:calcium ion binding [Branchiostoma belcheri]
MSVLQDAQNSTPVDPGNENRRPLHSPKIYTECLESAVSALACASASRWGPCVEKERTEPKMASRKAKKKAGSMRAKRVTSNVFAMFTSEQIQEFKEAFTWIDQNHDGFLQPDDLKGVFSELNKDPGGDGIDKMMADAPGPINFTCFLTIMGRKLKGVDTEEVMLDAFKILDPDETGKVAVSTIKELLVSGGEKFTDDELKGAFEGAPVEDGNLDYIKYCKIVKRGED